MPDPENESGFSKDSTGVYSDPSKMDTSKGDDFSTWTWKQIKAAITGGAALTGTADLSRVNGVSDPLTLKQAGQKLYEAQMTMQMVAKSIADQAEALAGEHGPWKGDGAESFNLQMKYLADQIRARAKQIAGGSAGEGNVPVQLINRGNDLTWAINAINYIDVYYADWVRQQFGGTGLAHIADHPEAVTQMTNQMRSVANTLSARYKLTMEGFKAVNADDYIPKPDPGSGNPDSGDGKTKTNPNPDPPNPGGGKSDPNPDPPNPDTADPPPNPKTETPPPSPDPASASAASPSAAGVDPPSGADSVAVPDASTFAADPTPDPLDVGASDVGASDVGASDVSALDNATGIPGAEVGTDESTPGLDGFDDSSSTPGLAALTPVPGVAGLPLNSTIPKNGSSSQLTSNPNPFDADSPSGGGGIPGSATGGAPAEANVPALSDLPASSATTTPATVPLSALSSAPSANGTSAGGAMPPPMGGGAGPSSPGTERSDAAGLLAGDVAPWKGADLPAGLANEGAAAAGSTSWAPSEASAPPMAPPMGTGGGPSSPGTERSDASGLLEGDVQPWETENPASQVAAEGAPAAGSAPWAPEARAVAADGSPVSAPSPESLTAAPISPFGTSAPMAGEMTPPMGSAAGTGSPGTERSHAAGSLAADGQPWPSPDLPSDVDTQGEAAAHPASWAPPAGPNSAETDAVGVGDTADAADGQSVDEQNVAPDPGLDDVDDFSGWELGRADFMSSFLAAAGPSGPPGGDAAPLAPTGTDQAPTAGSVPDLGPIGLLAVAGSVAASGDRKTYQRKKIETTDDGLPADFLLGCADGPSDPQAEESADDPEPDVEAEDEKPFSVATYLSGDASVWGGNAS